MMPQEWLGTLKWLVPQALTASRVLLGGAALFAALNQQTELAAVWITLAPITDCLDGPVARRLKVTSEFGSLFDYFADYLCYIVVPVLLSWNALGGDAGWFYAGILGLPLAAGAARYARNALMLRSESFDDLGLPGLGTVFYGLFVVALVFLENQGAVSGALLVGILVPGALLFSAGMLLTLRYPKLMKYRWVLIPVVAGLAMVPFALTTPLAVCMLLLILSYALVSPWLIRQSPRPEKPDAVSKGLHR